MRWDGERPGSDPESTQHLQKPCCSLNVTGPVGVSYGLIF